MPKFIDFAMVKERVSFAETIDLLDLKLTLAGNQFRGPCPCGKGDRRALVVTEGEGFFCQGARTGGDQIALVAHVLEMRMRDAALELADRAGIEPGGNGTVGTVSTSTRTSDRRRTVPENEPESERAVRKAPAVRERGGVQRSPPQTSGFDPDRYAAGLDYEHELLLEADGDPEKLRAAGIGYAPRGIHRGRIAIRVTDEDGHVCFVSVEGTIHLPPNLKTNVVPLKKRA